MCDHFPGHAWMRHTMPGSVYRETTETNELYSNVLVIQTVPKTPVTHFTPSDNHKGLKFLANECCTALCAYSLCGNRDGGGSVRPNLIGVVPLRLIFDVEHERVRYEDFQAWLVTLGN